MSYGETEYLGAGVEYPFGNISGPALVHTFDYHNQERCVDLVDRHAAYDWEYVRLQAFPLDATSLFIFTLTPSFKPQAGQCFEVGCF